MSYGEYKFGDFAKYYESGGPSDALVGFAEGFAKGFVPAYNAANQAARDKELALAKLDKQAEIDAAKAKTKANSDHNDYMKQAREMVDNLALPDGINPNDVVMQAYGMLSAKIPVTTVFNTLRDASKGENSEFVYEGDTAPTETAPAETDVAPTDTPDAPASPLTNEMNDLFGEAKPTDTGADTVETSEVTTEPTDDGSYEEASLGEGWATRYRDRNSARVKSATDTRLASLDTQNDVTSPEGLGGSNTSEIVAADADGTTTASERAEANRAVLKIRPKIKAKVADEIKVEDLDSYDKAFAAVVALTGVEGKENELARATFLMNNFAETPNIGKMSLQELQAFMEASETGPAMTNEYKRIDPQVMDSLRTQAAAFISDLQTDALPSLQETDLNKLKGVQADIRAGKVRNVSDVYKDELAARVKALEEQAEAERMANITFNEAHVEKMFFMERQRIYRDPDLSDEAKAAAWTKWQETEGAALQQILRAGDAPDKPQEINTIEEAAIVELRESEEFKGANQAAQLDMIEQLKRFLEKTPEGSLTQAKYADLVANYTLMLSSNNPEEVAEAEGWFNNISPALQAGLAAGAKATARPGDQKTFQIRYTDAQGNTRRSEAVQTDTGYQIIGGTGGQTTVSLDQVIEARSSDNLEYVNDQLSRTNTTRKEQRDKMTSLIDLTQQAYSLEQIALNDPLVLTMVGSGTATVEGLRNEARAFNQLIDLVADTAQGAYNENMGSVETNNRVNQAIESFIKDNNVTAETAANYRQFSAKLTRFVFAAGKALGQEGNGFSNQDYTNILGSLKAGNGLEAFVKNLRSFVSERASFVDAGAGALLEEPEIRDLMESNVELGYATMTFADYSKSKYAPVDYAQWLTSPLPKGQSNASSSSERPKVILEKGPDGVWTLPTKK